MNDRVNFTQSYKPVKLKVQMPNSQDFTERFIEVCGSSRPTDIQQLLGISYQAAKNYLSGRLPNTEVLLAISERTPFSIDWLLTGRGKKFIDKAMSVDTPPPAGRMESFVRQICVEVINEMIPEREPNRSRIVVLPASDVLSERVPAEANVTPES